jgi:hypothetical protein
VLAKIRYDLLPSANPFIDVWIVPVASSCNVFDNVLVSELST